MLIHRARSLRSCVRRGVSLAEYFYPENLNPPGTERSINYVELIVQTHNLQKTGVSLM